MSTSQPSAPPPIEVHLAFDQNGANDTRMAGELRIGEGLPRRFCSWLELIAAIEAAKRGEDR